MNKPVENVPEKIPEKVPEKMPDPIQTGPQINLEDLEASAEEIYKTLLNNSPGATGLNFNDFRVAMRRLGIVGTETDMRKLFDKFAHKKTLELNLQGFKALLNYRMAQDMGQPGKILDATLGAFAKEDVFNTGQLTNEQLHSLYKKLR